MAEIRLSVVVPEREVFSGTVDEVSLPGSVGGLGILPGHAALLTLLSGAELSFRAGGQRRTLKILGGFAEVTPLSVQVLADGVVEGSPIV